MEIIDAKWTPVVNWLIMRCSCGRIFQHRADRWVARCVICKRQGHLTALRHNYVQAARAHAVANDRGIDR